MSSRLASENEPNEINHSLGSNLTQSRTSLHHINIDNNLHRRESNSSTHQIMHPNTSFSLGNISNNATFDAFDMHGSTSEQHGDEVPDGIEHDHLSSGIDLIDLNHIHQSLSYVTHYKRRNINEKLPPILMYEINELGESVYVTMTLRELLNYVNQEAYELDEAYVQRMKENLSQKLAQSFPTAPAKSALSSNHGSSSNLTGLDVSHSKDSSHVNDIHRTMQRSNTTGGGSNRSPLSASNSSSNLVAVGANSSTSSNPPNPTHRDHGTTVSSSSNATHPPASHHAHHEQPQKGYDSVRELRLRDLRRLDFQFNPNEEKLILIRRHAVLIAMDPIRAVIMARRLILIVPDGADTLLSILDQHMREWVKEEKLHQMETSQPVDAEGNVDENHLTPEEAVAIRSNASVANRQRYEHTTPFEFNAYEALLTTVKALETQEFLTLQASVNETLSYFKSGK